MALSMVLEPLKGEVQGLVRLPEPQNTVGRDTGINGSQSWALPRTKFKTRQVRNKCKEIKQHK